MPFRVGVGLQLRPAQIGEARDGGREEGEGWKDCMYKLEERGLAGSWEQPGIMRQERRNGSVQQVQQQGTDGRRRLVNRSWRRNGPGGLVQ